MAPKTLNTSINKKLIKAIKEVDDLIKELKAIINKKL